MNKTDEELNIEIKEHRDNAGESFRAGQAIHRDYMDAPDNMNLSDEIERFSDKLSEGIDESDKAEKLEDERSGGKF